MTGAQAPDGEVLEVRLATSTLSVSAFHSLLRTTQAAIREVAQNTPEGAAAFAGSPSPQLVMEISGAGASGLTLRFRFALPGPGHVTHPVSGPAFTAFLDSLTAFIKSSPMRTLWGGVRTRGEAMRRPAREAGPLDERMAQVKAELERFGDAAIEFRGRRIELSAGGVQISP